MIELLLACAACAVIGYCVGRVRPIMLLRAWAHDYLMWDIDQDSGRLRPLRQIAVIGLLPEVFAKALWYRLRHGGWPEPPPPRVSPAPALVIHKGDRS